LVPDGHVCVFRSSAGYWYASAHPSAMHVTELHVSVPIFDNGSIDMAVLKPILPVSALHAARLAQLVGPGGMILISYQGFPVLESTENSATV
jgi:hypothetical protein